MKKLEYQDIHWKYDWKFRFLQGKNLFNIATHLQKKHIKMNKS